MQVQCTNPDTKSVTLGKLGGVKVVFSKNGFATVSDAVGQYLVRCYPAIVTKRKAQRRSRRTAVNEPVEPIKAVGTDSETSDVETQKEGE